MIRLTSLFFIAIALTVPVLSQTSLKAGTSAPVFSGTSLDEKPYNLEDLRGSVVVVTFWSTKCLICHGELPKLSRATASYDAKKVVFLALSMENETKVAAYLQKNPLNFQVLPNSLGTLLKYADRDKAGNLDMGFPSFFVIDQEGVIRHRASGYGKTSGLESVIGKLTAK